jgi:hypothetical protein
LHISLLLKMRKIKVLQRSQGQSESKLSLEFSYGHRSPKEKIISLPKRRKLKFRKKSRLGQRLGQESLILSKTVKVSNNQ